MENKTKKKKAPSPYKAILEKQWARGVPAAYNYDVCIMRVERMPRHNPLLTYIKRYPLGFVTRQEAGEARRNLLDIFLMEHGSK